MLTDERLKEIRTRAEAATPSDDLHLERYDHGGGRLYTVLGGKPRHLVADFYGSPDEREFYYHARTDIPALLDELEALRAHLSAAGIKRPEGLIRLAESAKWLMENVEERRKTEYATEAMWDYKEPWLYRSWRATRDALRACTGEEEPPPTPECPLSPHGRHGWGEWKPYMGSMTKQVRTCGYCRGVEFTGEG